MNIRQGLAGLVLTGFSAFVSAQGESCPAVDCDCSALQAPSWRSICQNAERTIAEECDAHDGKPQSYCRMHGPEGFPVAVSTQYPELPYLAPRDWSDSELSAGVKQANTALWSLQEDLKSLADFLRSGQNVPAAKIAKLVEENSERLFLLQREVVNSARSLSREENRELVLGYNRSWQDLTGKFEAYSDRLLSQAANQDANGQKLYTQLGYKLSRMAAESQEYAAYVAAQAGYHATSAKAWQQAASISEQLVTRSLADGAPQQYVAFYREQASARWFRATYHWLQTEQNDEAQISFQNAEHMALQASDSSVAEALEGGE